LPAASQNAVDSTEARPATTYDAATSSADGQARKTTALM
jgi:hypothetical protein